MMMAPSLGAAVPFQNLDPGLPRAKSAADRPACFGLRPESHALIGRKSFKTHPSWCRGGCAWQRPL